MRLSSSACLFKVQIRFPTFSRSYTTPPFPGTNLKKTSPLPQKSPMSIEDDLLLCTGKNRYGAVDGKKERKWQEMDLRYWTGKESKRTQKVSSVKFFLISWYKIMLLSSHFKWQCSSILLKKRWKRVVVIWFLHFFLQLFKKKNWWFFFLSSHRPSLDEKEDPSAGIMKLLKDMYDDGDDEMKRSIQKAMYESQSKQSKGDFGI